MKHNKLIFGIIGLTLFCLTTNLNAQVPCGSRLIENVDFTYNGGGATPARWDITQTDAASQGLTFDNTTFSYVSTVNFSNVRMNNTGTNNNTRQYAIVSTPNTLNPPQYANIPATNGMLVINPLQGNADNYFSFSIGGLIPGNVYKVEIKVYNVLALNCSTGYCQGGGTTNWTNVGDIVRVLGTFNASNPGDKSAAQNINWTGSNGSGNWNVQGTNPIYDMLRPSTAGTYAIMTTDVTLQPGNTSFSLNFSKQNTADPIVLGIDYIKVYGCQQEAINISGGTNSVCESSDLTLTAQGLAPAGDSFAWYKNGILLPGRTKDTLNIITPAGSGTNVTYESRGTWANKSVTLTSKMCCNSVGGSSDEIPSTKQSFDGLTYTCTAGRYGGYAEIPNKNITNFIDPAYIYAGSPCNSLNDGQYAVVKSSFAGDYWRGRPEVNDHTGVAGSGALFINAIGGVGQIFYKFDLGTGLCPQTMYEFSAWYASLATGSETKPNIEFDVMNGATLVDKTTTGVIPVNSTWYQAAVTFVTPASGIPTYTLQLANLVSASSGNDLMIDDIVVKKCTPKIDLYQDGEKSPELVVCSNNPINLKIKTTFDLPTMMTGSAGGTVYFQWMDAISPTGPWNLIGTPVTTGTYTATPIATAKYYRAKVSADYGRASTGTPPLATDCGNDGMTSIFKLTKAGNLTLNVTGTTAYCVGDAMSIVGDPDTGTKWGWMKGTDTIPGYGLSNIVAKKTLTRTFATGDGDNYYFVVKNASGCEAKFLVAVTEKPSPTVNNIPNQTILSATSSTAVTLSSTPVGATFAWNSSSSNASGATASGAGNVPAQVLTGTSATIPGVVTYTVTPTLNTCVGPTKSFDVNIAKLVAVKSGAWDTSVLTGNSVNFIIDTSGSILPTGGSITTVWETSTDSGITWFASPAPPFSPAVDTKYKATVTMKDALNAPVGASIVLVQDLVVVNIIMDSDVTVNYCPGENLSLVGDGMGIVSWSWYIKGDVPPVAGASSLIADQTLNLINVTTDTVWYFRGFTGDPIPFFADQEFKIRKRPDYTFTVDKAVVGTCQNGVTTITATKSIAAAPNAIYTWTGLGGTTDASTSVFTLNTTVAGSGIINIDAQAVGYCNTNINIPYTISNLVLDTIGWDNSICKGTNTTLTVDTTGTGALAPGTNLIILWEKRPNSQAIWTTMANQAIPLVQTDTPTESTQYRITLTTKDAANNILCSKTLTHLLTVIDLQMGATRTHEICKGASVSLQGETGTGTQWQWLDEFNIVILPWSSNMVDQRLQNQFPADTTFYYFEARNGTCVERQQHFVNVQKFIDFTVNPITVVACKGDVVNIVPTSTDPVAGVNYSWSVDGGTAVNTTNFAVPTAIAKNGMISVMPNAVGYCAKAILIPYSITELIVTPDIFPTTFCPDATVNLSMTVSQTGALPMTMDWYENGTPQGINSLSASFNPTQTSTYRFDVSTGVCSETYTQTITKVNVNIDIADNSTYSCPGEPINLTAITDATGIFSITWTKQGESELIASNVNKTGNIITVSPIENTKYTATINNTGCQNSDNITVYMHPVPDIIDITELDPRTIQIFANGGTPAYQYSVDNANSFISDINIFDNLRIGKHTAYVIDYNNCKTSRPFIINEIPLDFPPYFSPNGDGLNETWLVKNLELYYQIDMKIFDRFGKELTKITDSTISWDGTYLKKPMPSDDYWYVLYINETGKKFVGHFTLIR